MDFGGGDQIRFERSGKAGFITLTRPKALNAVTHAMVKAMARALAAWAEDPAIAVVVVESEGRAFSAGGDIMDIYEAGRAGNPPVDFFADEYRLNAAIERFGKPYVALVDGLAMGGGVGISFHGSHRVATENAQFAMPEVGIGFFPDVGGSFLLPNLGGNFGVYLGLTGKRIRWGDMLWSGLATHTVEAAYLPGLLEGIAESGDPGGELRGVFRAVPRETNDGDFHSVARHFGLGSVRDIMVSLEQSAGGDEFAASTLAAMREKSPTSLEVAYRAIAAGSSLSMDECMRMEFRIVNRMLRGHDFYEGIRAAIIDKGSRPQWRPATLDAVHPADIETYFAPLAAGDCPVSDFAEEPAQIGPSPVEHVLIWFQRAIAAYCLLFGVLYWIRLIGLYEGPLWRFDLMPIHWQVAAVTLSVFFPFAAIGLWMLASWGPVIWFICAATETVMYAGFPELFGSRMSLVVSHLLVASFYALLRFLIFWQKRKRQQ